MKISNLYGLGQMPLRPPPTAQRPQLPSALPTASQTQLSAQQQMNEVMSHIIALNQLRDSTDAVVKNCAGGGTQAARGPLTTAMSLRSKFEDRAGNPTLTGLFFPEFKLIFDALRSINRAYAPPPGVKSWSSQQVNVAACDAAAIAILTRFIGVMPAPTMEPKRTPILKQLFDMPAATVEALYTSFLSGAPAPGLSFNAQDLLSNRSNLMLVRAELMRRRIKAPPLITGELAVAPLPAPMKPDSTLAAPKPKAVLPDPNVPFAQWTERPSDDWLIKNFVPDYVRHMLNTELRNDQIVKLVEGLKSGTFDKSIRSPDMVMRYKDIIIEVATKKGLIPAPPATNTGTTATDVQMPTESVKPAVGSSSSAVTAAPPPAVTTIEEAKAEKQILQVAAEQAASTAAPAPAGMSGTTKLLLGAAILGGGYYWYKRRRA